MKKSLGAKTIIFPTPVWVVGTYDDQDRPNAMTVAWGGMCCSKPPCVGVSLRKATYSYAGILKHRAFTVNVPSQNHAREADYFGMASGRDKDKFAATGLTAVKSDRVDAPYIEEFPLILECKLLHAVEIGLHTQFIGEIIDIKADEGILNGDGDPDITRVHPFVYAPGMRQYFGIGEYIGHAYTMGKDF